MAKTKNSKGPQGMATLEGLLSGRATSQKATSQ